MSENSLEEVIRAYRKKLLFTPHTLNQMNLSDRMILKEEVVETILNGHVIEEYPDDRRGKSYLICSAKPGRIIHVVKFFFCSELSRFIKSTRAFKKRKYISGNRLEILIPFFI
jgi:hypothetical protein